MHLSASIPNNRVRSIDLLRGVVMIIMALDHTRDLFHDQALLQDPLNIDTTTPSLFFTRWITHICAPVFVFLSGTSIYLQSLRKTRKQLSRFLFTRGLWLIFLELAVMTLIMTFDIRYSFFLLVVIWAIGISMVLMSALIWLSYKWIIALGLIIIFGHNLLDIYESDNQGGFSVFYSLLHRQAFLPFIHHHVLGILYPFLPWTGLMMVGFAFGKLFDGTIDVRRQRKTVAIIGYALIAIFICLRASNVYGDPSHWSVRDSSTYTLMSFLNTTKYPPSLLFICMTIGPALIFLAYMNSAKNRITHLVTVFGRVPLFYYILHFFVLHLVSAMFTIGRGHSFNEAAKGAPGIPFKFLFPGEGFSLGGVYIVWILLIVLLYPLCKLYADYKARNKKWWLSYL